MTTYNETYNEIKRKVDEWYKGHPTGIANFVKDTLQSKDKEAFEELKDFVEYADLYGLKDVLVKSYIDAKYQLKELAIKNNAINLTNKEEVFYDWLKICVNPQKERNYDFYFEKNQLDKENEVKKILFEKNGDGPLREIFEENGWQIRLRTIANWFLKRYDIKTAKKIYKHINPPHKTIFDKMGLFIPRLFGAVFIGFLPLIMGQDTWELPLKLGWFWTFILSALSLGFAYLYLTIECYNVIKRKRDACKRAAVICFWGSVYSFVGAFFIVIVWGKHFISQALIIKGVNFMGMQIFLENILLFASLAFLIGIFIQVFWEEKTITEPL